MISYVITLLILCYNNNIIIINAYIPTGSDFFLVTREMSEICLYLQEKKISQIDSNLCIKMFSIPPSLCLAAGRVHSRVRGK